MLMRIIDCLLECLFMMLCIAVGVLGILVIGL